MPPLAWWLLVRRRVLHQSPERRLVARFAAEPLAPGKAGRAAAEAVAAAGPKALLGDVEHVVCELVADAIRHTEAPVELTVDTHDDVVRVEVRGEGSPIPLGAGSLAGRGTVVWCELRDQPGDR